MSIQEYPEIISFCLDIFRHYLDTKILGQSCRFLSNLVYFTYSKSKHTKNSNKKILKKNIDFLK